MTALTVLCSFWLTGCPEPEPETEVPVSMTEHVDGPKLLYLSGTQKCLTFDRKVGRRVIQNDCSLDKRNEIEIVELSDKSYNIRIPSTNLCLEVVGASKESGALTRFAPCNKEPNQNITFLTSKRDFFFRKIVFAHSQKCLGTSDLNRSKGILLTQNDCQDVIWQDFLVAKPREARRPIPRHIWSFWDKGEDAMPEFYKANVKRWEKVLNRGKTPENRWEIKIISLIKGDKNYYGNFIDEARIPQMSLIASKIGTQSFESRLKPWVIVSDFIRVEFLHEFGGVWMDPSIILHESLDDTCNVLETLQNFNIAAFTSRSQGEYTLRYADSFENFFIISFPKLDLVDVWKSNFKNYWDLKQPGMSIHMNPLYNGSRGVTLDLSPFGGAADYLNEHVAFKYTIVTQPHFLDEVLLFGDTQSREKGPFTMLVSVGWEDSQFLKLSEPQMDRLESDLKGVLFSKFPSENSKVIREEMKSEEQFRDKRNIFGRLNSR